jgi:hypothetical protein
MLRVVADQKRSIGPVSNESLVIELFLDEHMDHAKGECGVRPRPYL